MIRTHERFGAPVRRATHERATMPAHVEVGVQREIGAASHEHTFRGDRGPHERARVFQLVGPSHREPGAPEELATLELEHRRVAVGGRRQGLGLRQGREHRAELGGRKRQAWHDFTRSIVPDPDGVKAGPTVMIP